MGNFKCDLLTFSKKKIDGQSLGFNSFDNNIHKSMTIRMSWRIGAFLIVIYSIIEIAVISARTDQQDGQLGFLLSLLLYMVILQYTI